MRVLIIGGYGTFGTRLASLLEDDPRLTLILAGRRLDAAERACRRKSAARLEPAFFDRNGDAGRRIAELAPDLVVDASGPFQAYGTDPYRIVRAALAAGANYIDLADGTDFVCGITELDAEARERGLFALAGASTFPALSGAAVRALTDRFDSVRSITAGVAPSPFARMGRNVIEAIASYAGQPVGGGRGLLDARRATIRVPGRVPLGPLRFGLVDVPDRVLLPKAIPGLREVWTGAGTRPQILFRFLQLMAGGVRLRVLPGLSPFAGIMHLAQNRIAWGEHRGGFFVELRGTQRGVPVRAGWHVLTEGDSGPFIPTMAAAAIIRRCLEGRAPRAGARPAVNELSLADFEPFLSRLNISHGFREERAGTLFERLLGSSYGSLAPAIQAAHSFESSLRLRGRAEISRGRSWVSNAIANAMGFLAAGSDVEVQVELTRRGGVETWRRTFNGRSFRSVQEEGGGRYEGLLVERFGPLSFAMAAIEEQGRLRLIMRGWDAWGLPMPRALGPRIEAVEHDAGGRFNFDVRIALPLLGLIVHYAGWLEPER